MSQVQQAMVTFKSAAVIFAESNYLAVACTVVHACVELNLIIKRTAKLGWKFMN